MRVCDRCGGKKARFLDRVPNLGCDMVLILDYDLCEKCWQRLGCLIEHYLDPANVSDGKSSLDGEGA